MIFPSPDIHLAVIEDDLVALDLSTDAYFCLPDLGTHLSKGAGGGWNPATPGIAEGLIETGLFQLTPTPARGPAIPRVVMTSRAYVGERVGAAGALTLLGVMFREAGRVNGHPLKALIARSPSLPLRFDQTREAMAEAQAFDRWMPWVPGQGQCLYRAYLLRAFLASRARGSTWVFGVRTWPFSAHCWLQIGDVLLDDDLDRVSLYTPILAIEA